jgi:hypothetical protein
LFSLFFFIAILNLFDLFFQQMDHSPIVGLDGEEMFLRGTTFDTMEDFASENVIGGMFTGGLSQDIFAGALKSLSPSPDSQSDLAPKDDGLNNKTKTLSEESQTSISQHSNVKESGLPPTITPSFSPTTTTSALSQLAQIGAHPDVLQNIFKPFYFPGIDVLPTQPRVDMGITQAPPVNTQQPTTPRVNVTKPPLSTPTTPNTKKRGLPKSQVTTRRKRRTKPTNHERFEGIAKQLADVTKELAKTQSMQQQTQILWNQTRQDLAVLEEQHKKTIDELKLLEKKVSINAHVSQVQAELALSTVYSISSNTENTLRNEMATHRMINKDQGCAPLAIMYSAQSDLPDTSTISDETTPTTTSSPLLLSCYDCKAKANILRYIRIEDDYGLCRLCFRKYTVAIVTPAFKSDCLF